MEQQKEYKCNSCFCRTECNEGEYVDMKCEQVKALFADKKGSKEKENEPREKNC